jgi:hypothetical protein
MWKASTGPIVRRLEAIMVHLHDLHVIPDVVGWKVVATPQAEPLAVTRTREEAVALAKRMEYEDPDCGDVLIHGPDGSILERCHVTHADLFPHRG